MAIAGDVQIKVNSTVLRDKADAVTKSIKQMQEQYDQLEQIVNKTSYYWIGEAICTERHIMSRNRRLKKC